MKKNSIIGKLDQPKKPAEQLQALLMRSDLSVVETIQKAKQILKQVKPS
jgi:hypothetical protein